MSPAWNRVVNVPVALVVKVQRVIDLRCEIDNP